MTMPTPQQQADNPETPVRLLREMMLMPNLAPLLARNHALPAELLTQLSRSLEPTVRQAVASNPNTPAATLAELMATFPAEVLANPVLPLILIDQPNFAEQLSETAQLAILRLAGAPLAFVRAIARRGAAEARPVAEEHISLTGEAGPKYHEQALNRLVASFKPTALDALLLALPGLLGEAEIHWLSMSRAFPRVLALAATTPPDFLKEVLSHTPDVGVRALIAAHSACTDEMLDMLAADVVSVRRALASRHHLPLRLAYDLAQDTDDEVRQMLAANPYIAADELKILARDKQVLVRAAVLRNPATPREVFAALCGENHLTMQGAALASPHQDPAVLAQALKVSEVALRCAAAANPRLPAKYLAAVAREIGHQVAIAPERLDPDLVAVAEQVAANPTTPPEALRLLAHLPSMALVRGVARNPSAPLKLLAELAEKDDRDCQLMVAGNPNTPGTVATKLALYDVELCAVVLGRTDAAKLPARAIFQGLLEGLTGALGPRVAHRPSSGSVILATLLANIVPRYPTLTAESLDWRQRYALAVWSSTPPITLAHLTQDGHRLVRAAARATLGQSVSHVKEVV